MDSTQDTTDSDPATDSSDDSDWKDKYPSETIDAVPITESTAGVTVTRYDFDRVDMPPMFQISEDYPPEDGVENESVGVHGERAAVDLINALSELLAGRIDEVDWDDV